jgi:hypothetical protein
MRSNHRRITYQRKMNYWEIIADNLKKAGWKFGCISSTDHEGRQFWVVAAEREDAGRFIVHADEMLIAFLELRAAIHRRFELGWKVMRSSMFC